MAWRCSWMCPGLQGLHWKPWHHQRDAVGQDLHLSLAKCHCSGFDPWSVDKQDKRSPSANLCASLPSLLHQRSGNLLPRQGRGVLRWISTTKQHAVRQFFAYLFTHTHTHTFHRTLSLPLCPWQTLVISARAADRSPGRVSALATVGSGGKMEGVMEDDRRITWGLLPKATLLVSWHQKWWFRRWHRMITQPSASCVNISPCHLQITKIKSWWNRARRGEARRGEKRRTLDAIDCTKL